MNYTVLFKYAQQQQQKTPTDNQARFLKYLTLAQIASDAGKRILSSTHPEAVKALLKGYAVKDFYIRKAMQAAKDLPEVKITKGKDEEGRPVIYFDIADTGQVSFHTPGREWNDLPEGQWTGDKGESREVLNRLNKETGLKMYNYKPPKVELDKAASILKLAQNIINNPSPI